MSDGNVFLSLIIPAYNEENRIAATLVTVEEYLAGLGKPCEVILVDDGSADGTLRAAHEGTRDGVETRAVSYKPNRGKGYAVRQGVLESRGEYVAFSDADLSAPIDQLSKLFDAIDGGCDIAIGSRAARGAEIPIHQPLYRELGGKALNLVIRARAVRGIHDTQCGFKLFKGEAARAVFSKCFLNGWGFDVEVLYLARRMGYSIDEIPVKWSHAEGSKIHPFQAGIRVLEDLIRMRLHDYGPLEGTGNRREGNQPRKHEIAKARKGKGGIRKSPD